MTDDTPGLLRFREGYFERVWGGDKLRTVLGKDTPGGKTIGEAWLISDHSSHESVVAEGPFEGVTLRQLLEKNPRAILGARARPTVHGRFPLLLKLLDTAQALSVQVHPDDETAARLGEPDVGKTEMWHVLEADPRGELICGLKPGVPAEALSDAAKDTSIEDLLLRFEAPADTSVFVVAGTVHAIGGGMLLAEIQQNSDLTYRLYDWGRVDAAGRARELHLEKALQATHFDAPHAGPATPLRYEAEGNVRTVLAACNHFAAELLACSGSLRRATRGETFHILLAKAGTLEVRAGADAIRLAPGQALLASGRLEAFEVTGEGELLDYYAPDLEQDVVAPLRAAGHDPGAIARLGGTIERSDLAPLALRGV